MFKEYINSPIDPIPDVYVNNIHRLCGEPDYSLTCLGIALLRPRIEKYNGINGLFSGFSEEYTCVKDFIDARSEMDYENPVLCYYRYSSESSDEEIRKLISENGFEIKESIGALIKEKANIKCTAIYHKERNCAAIFIKSTDIRFYHLLISFISLLFPNLFKDKPLSQPNDYNLIKSLSKTDKNAFVRQIQESVKRYANEFMHIMLSDFLKNMHEAKINQSLREVNTYREHIKAIENQYAEAIKQLKEKIAMYEGMKATEYVDKPEEELIDYLSSNHSIHNLKVSGDMLSFTVATTLNNYNENAWATFNERGYIYDGDYRKQILGAFNDKNNRKLFLNSLFSESPEFTIKIAGNYSINLSNCYVSTSSRYDYQAADPIYSSYLPNPHLKLFECLGGYKERIIRALKERNLIVAVELCCASAGSVDLDETDQTFRPFLGWIMSSRENILIRKCDGIEMTPEEALLYLIDKEKENEAD